MKQHLTARRVTVSTEEQTLTVIWADGHTTAFPLDALRRTCPCAHCQGGHANMGTLPDPEVFLVPGLMRWENVRLAAAGTLGLRVTWDDGHDAGIYTWQRLRATCPCDACRAVED